MPILLHSIKFRKCEFSLAAKDSGENLIIGHGVIIQNAFGMHQSFFPFKIKFAVDQRCTPSFALQRLVVGQQRTLQGTMATTSSCMRRGWGLPHNACQPRARRVDVEPNWASSPKRVSYRARMGAGKAFGFYRPYASLRKKLRPFSPICNKASSNRSQQPMSCLRL